MSLVRVWELCNDPKYFRSTVNKLPDEILGELKTHDDSPVFFDVGVFEYIPHSNEVTICFLLEIKLVEYYTEDVYESYKRIFVEPSDDSHYLAKISKGRLISVSADEDLSCKCVSGEDCNYVFFTTNLHNVNIPVYRENWKFNPKTEYRARDYYVDDELLPCGRCLILDY